LKRLEGITAKEEEELGKLENENLKTIKEVYKLLITDKNIQNNLERIKSHKWVMIIEGDER